MDLQLPATGDCSAELQAALAANDSVRLLPHDGVEFVDHEMRRPVFLDEDDSLEGCRNSARLQMFKQQPVLLCLPSVVRCRDQSRYLEVNPFRSDRYSFRTRKEQAIRILGTAVDRGDWLPGDVANGWHRVRSFVVDMLVVRHGGPGGGICGIAGWKQQGDPYGESSPPMPFFVKDRDEDSAYIGIFGASDDGPTIVDLVRCSAHSRPDRLVRMVRTRSDARVVTKDCNGLPDGTWKASFSGLIDFTHNVDA